MHAKCGESQVRQDKNMYLISVKNNHMVPFVVTCHQCHICIFMVNECLYKESFKIYQLLEGSFVQVRIEIIQDSVWLAKHIYKSEHLAKTLDGIIHNL